ncbi:MAG TPA: ABC transporter ATP-binding protein [Mycobacteriales bacterium]|nr:ABC transporter ATP-binding protein [Mycobacteriales bacterium]
MTESPMPGQIRALGATLRISFRTDWRIATASLLLVPAGWLPATLLAVWVKLIVEGVSASDGGRIIVGVAGLVLSQVGGWAAGGLGKRLQKTFEDRAGVELSDALLRASAGRAGIDHLERPEYLDRLDPLRKEAWVVHWTLEALGETVGAAAQLALTIALLGSVAPVLLVLPLFGVPSLLIARRAGLRDRAAQEASGEARRRHQHLLRLSTSADAGAEIRVFGVAPALRRRLTDSWRVEHAIRARAAWVDAVGQAIGTLVFAAGFLGAAGLVGLRVAHGQAGVGDLALTLILARAMSNNLGMLVGMVQWLSACLAMGERFVWLRDEAVADARRRPNSVEPAPERLREGIALQDVSFGYPGTGRPVLAGLNVHFRPGEVVALVGENGAGKSTLVKLLCGLYEPECGQIRVDGVPLTAIDPVSWRSRVSGAFQDHTRFEISLGEAVTIGDMAALGDRVAAERALARADALDVLQAVPGGLGGRLGRQWPGGAELSGGQWQKVALARALMREPLLMVLDEPTANLDARTEDQLFARYAAESAALDRRVTLLVTHRFSTVTAADRILVLRGGRIVEDGSHAELLRQGGEYAQLYSLQARGYR